MKILTELKLGTPSDPLNPNSASKLGSAPASVDEAVDGEEIDIDFADGAPDSPAVDDDAAEAAFQAERNSVEAPRDPQANPETTGRDADAKKAAEKAALNQIVASSKPADTPQPLETPAPKPKSKKQLAEEEVEAAEKAEQEAKKVKEERDRALDKAQQTLDQEGGWMKMLSGIIGLVGKARDWKPLNTLSNLQTFVENRFRAEEDKKDYAPNFVNNIDAAYEMASERLRKAKRALDDIKDAEKDAKEEARERARNSGTTTPKPAPQQPTPDIDKGAALEAGSGSTPKVAAAAPVVTEVTETPSVAPAPQTPTPSPRPGSRDGSVAASHESTQNPDQEVQLPPTGQVGGLSSSDGAAALSNGAQRKTEAAAAAPDQLDQSSGRKLNQ